MSKKFWADTFAMISFSIFFGGFVELVIAGLSLSQTLASRLVGIPVDLIIGRPYGWLRDKVFAYFKAEKAGWVKKAVIDTLLFMFTQLPIYVVILLILKADPLQTFLASLGVVALTFFSGRPYGLYLEFCRKLFKVPTAANAAQENNGGLDKLVD